MSSTLIMTPLTATSLVSVFDHVFNRPACKLLDRAAAARGLGHALYPRESAPRTPLEHAFETFLRELGDNAPVVEYWARREWRHIEGHRDVDEALAAGGGKLRYPDHGHVLYLSVGRQVRGPTCVWEGGSDAKGYIGSSMATVPAVEGRVLRFSGALPHAVPRPADVWLAPFTVSQSGPADEFVRSVVLFNTWPDASEPPLGVERDDSVDTSEPVHCCPRNEWHEAPWRSVAETASGGDLRGDRQPATATMKLWLLGDVARRGQMERTLRVPVVRDATLKALAEPEHCTWLEPPDRS